MKRETYFVNSGAGDWNVWTAVETSDIKGLLQRERHGGYKWAHAYPVATASYNPQWECVDAINAETGEGKSIYDDAVIEFMRYL